MADKHHPAKTKASFPPQHKKRLRQGVAAYVILLCLTGGWLFKHRAETVAAWEARIPSASGPLLDTSKNPEVSPAPAADAAPPTPSPTEALTSPTPAPAAPEPPPAQTVPGSKPAMPAAAIAPVAQQPLPAPAPRDVSVAIIMTNAGLRRELTEKAIDTLPEKTAFAFSPYGMDLKSLFARAAAKKHETYILLPMEPVTYPKDDSGPRSLLTIQDDKQNAENLASILSSAEGATGAMNYMGSRFLADRKGMIGVFAALQQKKMSFVENTANGPAQANVTAYDSGVPYLSSSVTISFPLPQEDIDQRLATLESLAREQGHALGVVDLTPVSLEKIAAWEATLDKKDIHLVAPGALKKK
jgi:polysaccharide deacetylase 2 family uncharacterized protein YibQ